MYKYLTLKEVINNPELSGLVEDEVLSGHRIVPRGQRRLQPTVFGLCKISG